MATKALTRKVSIYINGKEVENTLKSLEAEMNKLKALQRGMTIGSEEYVKTSLKIKEIKSVLEEQKRAIRDVGTDWEKTREAAADYADILVGLKAATGKIAGAYNWAKGFVEEAAKMDDAYADVMKTTGLTHDEVLKLNEAFKQMDTRTPREQLNKLASEAGKLGLSAREDVEAFVSAADKINIALGEELGEGAMVTIGKLAQVYSKSTKELSDASEDIGSKMLKIGSALNSLGAASSANEANMSDFLSRLGGVAAQAGISAQQILGYASALDQANIPAERSATAFQTLIMKMYQTPAAFASIARTNVKEFNDLLKNDMNAAIQKVLAGLNEEGGMDKLAPLFKDLKMAGSGVTQTLGTLAANLNLVTEAQTIANAQMQTGNSILEEANTKNNTLQAQLEKATDRFHNTAETLGNALYPAIIGVTNAGSGLMKGLEGIISLLTRYPGILNPLIALGGAWLAMKAKALVVLTAQRVKELAVNVVKTAGIAITQRKVRFEQQELEIYHRRRAAEYQELIAKEELILADKAYTATVEGLARREQAEANIKAYSKSVTEHATAADAAHTAAIKAKNTAMKATPWGAIIGMATALVTVIHKLANRESELEKTINEANKQVFEEQGKLKVLKERLEGAAVGSEQYKNALDELRAQHPDIMKKYSDEYIAVNGLKGIYEELSAAVRQSVYDRMYAEKAGDLQGEVGKTLSEAMSYTSTLVKRELSDLSEAEQQSVKEAINTNLRDFAEGVQNYQTTAENIEKILKKHGSDLKGLAMGSFWSNVNDLNEKIKETDQTLKDLKTTFKPTDTDPFGLQKMNLEQMNGELEKAKKRIAELQQMQDVASNSPVGASDYSRQIMDQQKKVEALTAAIEAKNKAEHTSSTTTPRDPLPDPKEAKRKLDALNKVLEKGRDMATNIEVKTLNGIQKIEAEVHTKVKSMIEDIQNAARESAEAGNAVGKDVQAVIKQLTEAESKMVAYEVQEYLKKIGKEVDGFKKKFAKSEEGEAMNKVAAATENLNQQLVAVDDLIDKLKEDAKSAEGETLVQIQEKIRELNAVKADAVAAAYSSISTDVKNPFKKATDNPLDLLAHRRKALDEVAEKIKKYAKALEDAKKAEEAMAKTARENGNDALAKEHEAAAEAIKKEEANLSRLQERAEKLAGQDALKDTLNSWCDQVQQFSDQALAIFGNLNKLLDNIADSELQKMKQQKDDAVENLDEQLDAGLISQEEYEERKKKLEDDYAERENEVKLEQWKRQKALDLTQAIIGGALAAVRAYAEGGPIAGPILAALVSAATGLQIAAIANQPEPYAKGGFVNKKTYMMAGEAGREWVASNSLLTDGATAPIIDALEAYQRGNRRALEDIGMAQLRLPAAMAAAEEIGRSRVVVNPPSVTVAAPSSATSTVSDPQLLSVMRELASYMKDPKNRQAVISRRTMEDFEKNEGFLRNKARL